MNKLGPFIKRLRAFKGLTQEEVASRLFISLKAFQNIEHGITKLDIDRIKQLSIILSIPVNDLITDSELEVRFDDLKTTEGSNIKLNEANGSDVKDLYRRLLREKDNEIAFLRGLLDKLS